MHSGKCKVHVLSVHTTSGSIVWGVYITSKAAEAKGAAIIAQHGSVDRNDIKTSITQYVLDMTE